MNAAHLLGRLRRRMDGVRLSRRERTLLFGLLLLASVIWAAVNYEGARSARVVAEEAQAGLRLERARKAQLASPGFTRLIAQEADKARMWSLNEPTVYIAQMRAQSQLEDFAIAAGIANHEIIVDRPDPPEAGVQQVSMAVEGDFDWASYLAFLAFLESAEPSFVPLSAEVTTASVPSRFSLVLAAPYIPPGGGQ